MLVIVPMVHPVVRPYFWTGKGVCEICETANKVARSSLLM
ncbi:hypothetical protein THTE_3034 [Thermogutta terrifontis]|uniref:Uncharacterized protein n=1 Tax=Thermogutta terrifontis TaxID=1331910 RepID=A0A286RI76_9BACT|nr:hypothetical protein THTE_3034 [Thermogutta terrifontis]